MRTRVRDGVDPTSLSDSHSMLFCLDLDLGWDWDLGLGFGLAFAAAAGFFFWMTGFAGALFTALGAGADAVLGLAARRANSFISVTRFSGVHDGWATSFWI